MAGAMTPYHSQATKVKRDIPAGSELFKFYGDRWFASREETFGLIPLTEDYNVAQRMLNKFDKLRLEHFEGNNELRDDLYSLMKDTIGKSMWESRTMNALPQSADDAQKAADLGIHSLYQPTAIRDIDFLQKYGKCMDNIRAGTSTLPSGQGGRGAFATRFLKKGSIVTGTPVHHVPNKDFATMFHMIKNKTDGSSDGEETWLRFVDEIESFQMLLNYCYSHTETTMMLCPYGSGVNYINHNKTMANIRIQWAQNGLTSHNDSWLERRVEDFNWDFKIGLAFDYVAMRDIQEGEELFLDCKLMDAPCCDCLFTSLLYIL
jgi:hypothetical protein